VAAFVLANFFGPLTDVAAVTEFYGQAGAITDAITSMGSVYLLFALALIVTHGKSEVMVRFLRNTAIVAGVALALAVPLSRFSDEFRPSSSCLVLSDRS